MTPGIQDAAAPVMDGPAGNLDLPAVGGARLHAIDDHLAGQHGAPRAGRVVAEVLRQEPFRVLQLRSDTPFRRRDVALPRRDRLVFQFCCAQSSHVAGGQEGRQQRRFRRCPEHDVVGREEVGDGAGRDRQQVRGNVVQVERRDVQRREEDVAGDRQRPVHQRERPETRPAATAIRAAIAPRPVLVPDEVVQHRSLHRQRRGEPVVEPQHVGEHAQRQQLHADTHAADGVEHQPAPQRSDRARPGFHTIHCQLPVHCSPWKRLGL